jgi:hypothetical protein
MVIEIHSAIAAKRIDDTTCKRMGSTAASGDARYFNSGHASVVGLRAATRPRRTDGSESAVRAQLKSVAWARDGDDLRVVYDRRSQLVIDDPGGAVERLLELLRLGGLTHEHVEQPDRRLDVVELLAQHRPDAACAGIDTPTHVDTWVNAACRGPRCRLSGPDSG